MASMNSFKAFGLSTFLAGALLPAACAVDPTEVHDDDLAEEPTERVLGLCDQFDCAETYKFVTTAPLGLDESDLGRPVNREFDLMPESDTLYGGREVTSSNVSQVEHKYTFVENSLDLKANFKGWGVTAGVENTRSKRHASFRAQHINTVDEIDQRGGPTLESFDDIPADAYFYVSKVYYGHLYEAVVSGDERDFRLDVAAKFKIAEGGISLFAQNNRLSVEVLARGLTPRGEDALFSRTEEDIEANYELDYEVPILVEYSSVPRPQNTDNPLDDVDAYEWIKPKRVRVKWDNIFVDKDGTLFGATWRFHTVCKLNGEEILLDDPVVWENQTGVRSNRDYPLFWSTEFLVLPEDRIECGIEGTANNRDTIGYAGFEYNVLDFNGEQQGDFRSNSGGVEWRLDYTLEFLDEEAPVN